VGSMLSGTAARKTLRRHLRQQRVRLDASTLRAHTQSIHVELRRRLRFQAPRVLAAYWAVHGEIDLHPVLCEQVRLGGQVALPVLDRLHPGHMHYREWHPAAETRHNSFGIPEPRLDARRFWRRELHWVLVPLVAFDAWGTRLGMGGGYYDRYFACLRQRQRRPSRPWLIGIAHEFQRVARLERADWDVPLDGVVTETGWHPRHVWH
jgi:5-formyltetrahydrofolate cyclo-ligase